MELTRKQDMARAEQAAAKAEGLTVKAYRVVKAERDKAAEEKAIKDAADAKAAAEKLAAERAAPIYTLNFDLPYRRPDLYRELAHLSDPLDLPATDWLLDQSVPQESGMLRQAVVGMVRRAERRFVWPAQEVTLELCETKIPELLRWRMLEQRGLGTSLLPVEGEDYDGKRATPEWVLLLESMVYGTRVTIHVGAHGRLPAPWDSMHVSLLRCFTGTLSQTFREQWLRGMRSRGHEPLAEHRGGRAEAVARQRPASPPDTLVRSVERSVPLSHRSPLVNTIGLPSQRELVRTTWSAEGLSSKRPQQLDRDDIDRGFWATAE